MKTKLFSALAAAILLSSNPFTSPAVAGDATNELKELVTKIKTDFQAGKKTEAGLADDLKQFDALLAEHKGEKNGCRGPDTLHEGDVVCRSASQPD